MKQLRSPQLLRTSKICIPQNRPVEIRKLEVSSGEIGTVRSAPSMWAPSRLASLNTASRRSQPSRFTPRMFASEKSAPTKLHPLQKASLRADFANTAPSRLIPLRLAQPRSGENIGLLLPPPVPRNRTLFYLQDMFRISHSIAPPVIIRKP